MTNLLYVAIATVCVVGIGLLYIKTPLSIFARVIHAFYALLFFAIFVIDAAVQSAGLGFCNKAFANTVLNQDMSSLDMTITCSSDGETAIVVFDVVASGIFFILHSAWGLTPDLYIDKKDGSDSKYLLKKKAKSKR